MRRAIVILLMLPLAPLAAQDLGFAPTGVRWRRLATPHFTVLFGDGQDSVAQLVADKAEVAHRRLVPFLKWRPDRPTTVVVTDHNDEANALATTLPHPIIALRLNPPAGCPGNYGDWLDEVLLHEYAHILQLGMLDGFPAGLAAVFGRLYLPNAVQPLHLIEGLAVHAETEITPFGRNRGAYYDGVLRTFAAAGRWLPLDRAAVFSPHWPADAPYLFGGKFHQYLGRRYGWGAIARYQRRHSRLAVPFLHNWVARDVYGRSFPQLWRQWQEQALADYRRQADSIRGVPWPAAERLTATGFEKSQLAASRDGRWLAWIGSSGDEFPALKLRDGRSGEVRTLREGIFAGAISFSPDGTRIAAGRREYTADGSYRSDLYQVAVPSGRMRRLTRGLRAHDPAWSPDGCAILFVADRLGANALARYDVASAAVTLLTPYDAGARYSHPAWSPDGATVAVSVWCDGGYHDVYLCDAATGAFRPLTVDRAQDLAPAWSADGRSLYFASDRTGVWNVFRHDVDAGALHQVTNSVGGALAPAPCDGVVRFLDLSAGGWDVAAVGGGPEDVAVAAPFVDTLPDEVPDTIRERYPVSAYRPLASLAPYFWLPAVFADERRGALGIMCMGSDALTQINYSASAGYSGSTERPSYSLAVSDARWPVTLALSLSDMANARSVRSGNIAIGTYWEREQTQELGASYTLRRTWCSVTPAVAYRHQRSSALVWEVPERYRQYRPDPWTGHLSRLAVSCSYGDARRYGFSISPEHGRQLYAQAEFYRGWLGSDLDQTAAWARWREYLPTPFRHHVLMLDGRIGTWRAGRIGHFDDYPAFELRGFADDGFSTLSHLACVTVEYRFPLVRIERGVSTWPIYLKVLHGALFAETGIPHLAGRPLSFDDPHRSAGAELRSDWIFSYAVPARLMLGYAVTLVEPSSQQVYLSFGLDL
ncbi:MAG: hypothetical protein MUF78_02770 [Candidatus Edwardsbacteria bacterium]|nr:hypothetical protein [Candidatus Edwardsbacteria bacterium]